MIEFQFSVRENVSVCLERKEMKGNQNQTCYWQQKSESAKKMTISASSHLNITHFYLSH